MSPQIVSFKVLVIGSGGALYHENLTHDIFCGKLVAGDQKKHCTRVEQVSKVSAEQRIEFQTKLEGLMEEVASLAEQHQQDPRALLAILRSLEANHRRIRETHLQMALPSSRHELYDLLREIAETGGWPYIPRGNIRSLLNGGQLETETKSEEWDAK